MAITVVDVTNAAYTLSRSPSVTFAGYVPALDDIVVIWTSGSAAGSTVTEPSGWVNPLGTGVVVNTDAHHMTCGWHRVTSGEVSAVQETYTATNWYDATVTGNVVGVVLRGVDATTAVHAATSTFSDSNAGTPHTLIGVASGSVTLSDCLVISGVCSDGTRTYTDPGGWTVADVSNSTNGKWVGTRNTLTTSGVAVADTSITPSSGDEYASITVLFAPAASGIALTAPVAVLVLSGVAPTIAASGDATLTAPVATVALTGVAPTVAGAGDATLTAPVAVLVLTGVAPSLAAGTVTLTAPTATLTLSGVAPTLSTTSTALTAPVATLTLTGVVPTLTIDDGTIALAAPTAVLSLTGVAPTLTTGTATLTAPTAALTLTGVVPTITGVSVSLTAPIATLTLTGVTPTISIGSPPSIELDAPTATLTFTGIAPTIAASGTVSLTAPVATLALAGVVPTMSLGGYLVITGPRRIVELTGARRLVDLTPAHTIREVFP